MQARLARPAMALLVLLWVCPAAAKPTLVEPGWTQLKEFSFTKAQSARFNPVNNKIYVGRRGTSSDGVYLLESTGLSTLVASGSNVAAMVAAANGDIFFSEDYGGAIFKVALKTGARTKWIAGFHSGDDDPVGMAIAPAGYTGKALKPGEALVVDRGNAGADEVWMWHPALPSGGTVVHKDNGTLVDAVDVAISSSQAYLVDPAGSKPGVIYKLGAAGALSVMTTTKPLADPLGLTLDPLTGDLLVVDQKVGKVLRVAVTTGAVTEVVSGLTIQGSGWASIDVSADGRQLLITAKDKVHLLARCAVTPAGGAKDCDKNGKLDACDLALGTHKDCNANNLPDACDIAAKTSSDCDNNGVPDDCPACPPVEAVFVMDTSSSMNDEAAALCSKLKAVVADLAARGIKLTSSLYGITNTPGGAYSCLTSNVVTALGTSVPGSPPAALATLGKCPGGNQVGLEDWGRATAVVAGNKTWGANTVRLVVPISDEGPYCGDPVTDPGVDRDSITHAVKVCKANKVLASPITGTGSSAGVIKLAQELASGTGGKTMPSTKPNADLAKSVLNIIKSACNTFSDCNKNGRPDACDISTAGSKDCDKNKVPDECQTPAPTCLPPDAGVPDASPPDASVPDLLLPDLQQPDQSLPDLAQPDLAQPDLAQPDSAESDTTGPDSAAPDTAAADIATPDSAAPDSALPDSAAADAPASTMDTSDVPGGDSGAGSGDDGCECSTTSAPTAGATWLLLLLGLALRRRRAR